MARGAGRPDFRPRPHWHAHEMLFGYALAVVAGYLLSRVSRATLVALFLAWLAARVAPLVAAQGSAAIIAPNLLFAGLMAWQAAPPFLRAAKKPENRVFGPLFIAFAACELLYQLGARGLLAGSRRPRCCSRSICSRCSC